MSRYKLTVGAPLSNDAVLTSTVVTVSVTAPTGTVSGFNYGETLKSVVDNLVVPTGANLTIVDAQGAYVPFKYLNYDTVYVATPVSDQIWLVVVAEDGKTTITYQLHPTVSDTAAFVTSPIYVIDQVNSLIGQIPGSVTVSSLFKFLTPAPGATIKLIDKLGYDRTDGYISLDDQLVVTAADGIHMKTYFLSMQPFKKPYYAYVLSSAYTVDQINNSITGTTITNWTLVTDFVANLTVAPEATAVILDNQSTPKVDGYMAVGDQVQVTAGDLVTQKTYAVTVLTGVSKFNANPVNVFPNPTSGMVNLQGVARGSKIVVSNVLGQQLVEKIANMDLESISLQGQASGIYFIEISSNNNVTGRYKVILK